MQSLLCMLVALNLWCHLFSRKEATNLSASNWLNHLEALDKTSTTLIFFQNVPTHTHTHTQVVEGSGDKNIVLHMARSVGAEAMVNAVEGSVKPRMNGKDSGALQVYHQKKFSSYFYIYLQ